GATVPPHPAIEFLQISSALDTRGDEIPLVAGFRLQTTKILGVGVSAEGAPDPRRGPTAPTHVAGEPAPAILDDVNETGRCPAERAHPSCHTPSARCSRATKKYCSRRGRSVAALMNATSAASRPMR